MQNGNGRSYMTILITKVLNSREAELMMSVFKSFTFFLIFIQIFFFLFIYLTSSPFEIQLLKTLDLEEIGLQVAVLTSILVYSYAAYAISSAKSIVVAYLFVAFMVMNLTINLSPFFIVYLLMCVGGLKAVSYYRKLERVRIESEQEEEDEYYY
jgi:hypothetical protein